MFSKETFQKRREVLIGQLDSGLLLLLGNFDVGMNYAGNTFPFRQDSSFLYYFGIDQPGLGALIDLDAGTTTLFGDDLSLDDVVWMGPHPSLQSLATRVGVGKTAPYEALAKALQVARTQGRTIHFLPPYRYRNRLLLAKWLEQDPEHLAASEPLIRAIVAQRSIKSSEEVLEMEKALAITGTMHLAAMQGARPGKRESELSGLVEGIALGAGAHLAYPVILTVNGHILHNHDHSNMLEDGQMILGDFGAETNRCYAGDITRTFPVGKTFSRRQRVIYQLVLDAQLAAIAACKPGVPYRDVHLLAARKMTEGLIDIGIMQGNAEEAVAAGAHALFFPHGLGHMIGMDVHDMEDLGEDLVGYSDSIKRSDQFGTAYLRLGRALEPGFVLTVEPGLYFIPELIDQWQSEDKHATFINYDKVALWRDFTGVRIEDNILITADGARILGPAIPKTIEEVEKVRNR